MVRLLLVSPHIGSLAGWLAGLPSEITAFESKAHAKKDYSHVGKRGEMAARPTAQAPALAKHGRRARAVGGMLTS